MIMLGPFATTVDDSVVDVDEVSAQMSEVMTQAGNAFIAEHPDWFRVDCVS